MPKKFWPKTLKIEASQHPDIISQPVDPAGATTTDITTDDLTDNFAGLTEEEGPAY
jgi:hypothetical protein